MARFSDTRRWALVALAAATMLGAAPALTQSSAKLSALTRLEPGLWQLRDLDDRAAPPQSICVGDVSVLVQLKHRGAPCSRLVIANNVKEATVHYTCPTHGFGRTSVRVETPRLAQIDTQGILENLPFNNRMEARRTGSCGNGRGR